MLKERRYTQYSQHDVWVQLHNFEKALKVQLLGGTITGCSISLLKLDTNERLRAVILARSSHWYIYSLNIAEWNHGITCVVCGTHDSCVPVPVLALDAMKWYEPEKMRTDLGVLRPKFDTNDKPIPDQFDQTRRSHYGHNMLIGALMCNHDAAKVRLQSLPDRTRFRIEAELRDLH